MKPQEQWEVEFDKQFPFYLFHEGGMVSKNETIKSFIHSLLKAQEERLVGEIEQRVHWIDGEEIESENQKGYNQALSEIKSIIHSVYNK